METLHRDFGGKPGVPTRHITFTVNDRKFEAATRLSGWTQMKFTRAVKTIDQNKGSEGADAAALSELLMDFFTVVVRDFAAFEAYVEAPDTQIDLQELFDIFMWLMEAYAGRPFSTPSPSTDGPSANGDGSTDGSSSKDATTLADSTPTAG